jgi:hypothetical protein
MDNILDLYDKFLTVIQVCWLFLRFIGSSGV